MEEVVGGGGGWGARDVATDEEHPDWGMDLEGGEED